MRDDYYPAAIHHSTSRASALLRRLQPGGGQRLVRLFMDLMTEHVARGNAKRSLGANIAERRAAEDRGFRLGDPSGRVSTERSCQIIRATSSSDPDW